MCNTSEKEYLQETTIDLNGDRKKKTTEKTVEKSNEKKQMKEAKRKNAIDTFLFFFFIKKLTH